MVGVGSIVSVGGAGGGGGSGSTSGIQNLNGHTGPTVTLVGTSGIVIAPVAENIINIGFDASGVVGVNGINVEQVDGNFVVDGAGASGVGGGGGSTSGLCYAEDFAAVTSITVNHNLGTTNIVTNVFDSSDNQMFADRVGIVDINNIIILFNTPQTGKVVVMACGGNDANLCEAKRYALLVS